MKKKAFVNGKIFTSDREKPYAESFIAEDGYITWIGNREDMPGGEYEYVDLDEKRVIPGLIDCHMHPVILADCAKKISWSASGSHFYRRIGGGHQRDG